MYKYLLIMLPLTLNAGPYIELGIGIPLFPESGYIPDQYGIIDVGYTHRIDEMLSLDIAFGHRSLTGIDHCHQDHCAGDNVIETKVRLEW